VRWSFSIAWKFENESGRSFNVFRWSEGGPVERSGLCGGKGWGVGGWREGLERVLLGMRD